MLSTSICVVGLGYVGLPLLFKLAESGFTEVTGVDINSDRIDELNNGYDHTRMIPGRVFEAVAPTIKLRTAVGAAQVYIVCVPTPDIDGVPFYGFITNAVSAIAAVCPADATVVLESTVAPGITSGLVRNVLNEHGKDGVFLAYSPERINPGAGAYDEMSRGVKLLSVDSEDIAGHKLSSIYQQVFHRVMVVHDTRVAELAKCFENFQRDMNIAMMNELAMQCATRGVDYFAVCAALKTKNTGLNFHSGMVGGHCIPVDPYYLSEWYQEGLSSSHDLPAHSRVMNESYINFVVSMACSVKVHRDRKILVLGLTYKPDIADTRNSGGGKVWDKLLEKGQIVHAYDPVTLTDTRTPGTRYNVVIGAVNHAIFRHSRIIENIPLAIDCTFINVGQFTPSQLSNIHNVINL